MAQQGSMRSEVLNWEDVDALIDLLVPQIQAIGGFQVMLLITRGGVVPGGMLAEALDIRQLLIASVDFHGTEQSGLMAWPSFLQFPQTELLSGQRVLLVDDVWGSGRTSTAVRGRVEASGGEAFTCVMHFNPYRSLFSNRHPDFFAATTDSYIVYPWEVDRGTRGIGMNTPQPEIN